MAVTISQVEASRPDALVQGAADIGRQASQLADSVEQQRTTISGLRSRWQGTASDAATSNADALTQRMQQLQGSMTRLQSALQGGNDLVASRNQIVNSVTQLREQGWQVADDGTVSVKPGSTLDAFAQQSQTAATQLRSMAATESAKLKAALTQFEATDQKVSQNIRNSTTGLTQAPQAPAAPPTATDPKSLVSKLAGMTPDERSSFIAGLSPETVQEMVNADPQTMGNTDGVPFDTRIAANRINIQNALAAEKAKPNPDQSRINELQKMLSPMQDPLTGKTVDRKYVAFSTAGNGHFIEMVGDIQPGIKGVGVIVPGTGTNLNGSESNHNAAVNLASASHSPIFLYVNGDFPQSLDKAADPSYAANMAPGLVSFGHEVDRAVAQGAPGTKVTYVGHSYGGAIVGTAEQEGLRADRILHASSAGTGILDTQYHDPNPNVQRYSMTAPGDPIGLVQSIPHDVKLSDIPGANDIPGIPHNADGQIGNPLGNLPGVTDPDKIPGVTRLDTGYYGADNTTHPGHQVIAGPSGHGDYWNDPQSDAFKNIAAVIDGGTATEYVDRGIHTNYIDIKPGESDDFWAQAKDQLEAETSPHVPRLPWDSDGTYDRRQHPWDNPQVTSNPQEGQPIQVK